MDSERYGRREVMQAALLMGGLGAGLLGGARRSLAQDDPRGCRRHSRTPEVHSFYGTRAELSAKLRRFDDRLDLELGERNAHMYLFEAGDAAEIVLYRREDEKKPWRSWSWSGGRTDATGHEEQVRQILATRGDQSGSDYCLGAATQKLLESWSVSGRNATAPPPSAAEALTALTALAPKRPDDAYVRMDMYLLC
jgi:hypothetical protein